MLYLREHYDKIVGRCVLVEAQFGDHVPAICKASHHLLATVLVNVQIAANAAQAFVRVVNVAVLAIASHFPQLRIHELGLTEPAQDTMLAPLMIHALHLRHRAYYWKHEAEHLANRIIATGALPWAQCSEDKVCKLVVFGTAVWRDPAYDMGVILLAIHHTSAHFLKEEFGFLLSYGRNNFILRAGVYENRLALKIAQGLYLLSRLIIASRFNRVVD